MAKSFSLTLRAFIAVGLMLGFYILAIGISITLLLVPYAELRYGHRFPVRLVAICAMGGLAVLWSIIPRRDKFVPPGPLLEPQKQPRLFDLLSPSGNRYGAGNAV